MPRHANLRGGNCIRWGNFWLNDDKYEAIKSGAAFFTQMVQYWLGNCKFAWRKPAGVYFFFVLCWFCLNALHHYKQIPLFSALLICLIKKNRAALPHELFQDCHIMHMKHLHIWNISIGLLSSNWNSSAHLFNYGVMDNLWITKILWLRLFTFLVPLLRSHSQEPNNVRFSSDLIRRILDILQLPVTSDFKRYVCREKMNGDISAKQVS